MDATIKHVSKILAGMPTSDGAGVNLTRIIGSPEQNMFDPFLLLDVFESDQPADYIAGFPPHPHRGFETFTWLIDGRMRHEDNAGNGGVIEGGGAQWMNAGRGIIHSEMPEQEDGLLKGVQLWINRPARLKMSDPDYLDLTAADIPVEKLADGSKVRVMAGTTDADTAGPVTASPTEPLLLDISLVTGGTFSVTVPGAHNSFVWVADGDALVGGTEVSAGCAALLGDGDTIEVAAPIEPVRLLLASAGQIGEPVARGGPFVMNTKAEILQAFADFESGALGGSYYIPGKN